MQNKGHLLALKKTNYTNSMGFGIQAVCVVLHFVSFLLSSETLRLINPW